jgi:sterol desaturase/sphingolipid hydroxylase (fatty acid hydroxylase superfamily)
MCAERYKDATRGRFSLGNIGLEWLAPSAVVLVFCWGVMFLFNVPAVYQAIVLANLVAWPFFTFSFLHDAMHLHDFWMARMPVTHRWFRRARRLHDIHHHSADAAGRMDANFGIGFFLFDRVFRTLSTRHRPLNRKGLAIALQRYKLTMSLDCLRRESTPEGEAAVQ